MNTRTCLFLPNNLTSSSLHPRLGYPCGLWLLFHTMISNSDRAHAPLTLRTIFEWVQSFYGCIECAANFNEEWEEYNGDGRLD